MLDPSQPLWLPKGSVRAVIALFVTVVGTAYLVTTGADVKDILMLVLGFYFISRVANGSSTP